MKSGGRSSNSAHRELMTGICRSFVTSMIPWLMFSSVNWSCSAFWRAFASRRQDALHGREHDQCEDQARQAIELEVRAGAAEDFVVVQADADDEWMPADLTEGDEPGLAGRGIDVLERRVGGRPGAAEHRGVAEVLPQLEPAAAAAAGSNHAVLLPDQGDRRRGSEVDAIVEVGQMRRVERSDDDAAELSVAVEEAPRELDRPLTADAADDRLADEQTVLRSVEVDAIVLTVAQVDRRRGLRAGIGRPHDALGVDDRNLNDDLAQKVRRADDRVEVGRVLARLDDAPQVQERLVDLADGAENVLLEHHREIAIGTFRVAFVAADILNVFETDAAPQHGDDHTRRK